MGSDEVPRLETYHFHERTWDTYEQLREEFSWQLPDRFNAADYICDRWASDRGRVAFYVEETGGTRRAITFRELSRITDQLAHYFREVGLERGDRIAVNLPQRPELMAVFIAAWKLGAVVVPLSVLYGVDGLEYRLSDSGSSICVVDGSNLETYREARRKVSQTIHTLTLGSVAGRTATEVDFYRAIDGQPTSLRNARTSPHDDALIAYTSGTTGEPKGVLHGHRVILAHLPQFLTTMMNLEITGDDCYWTPSDWAWAVSFVLIAPMLYYGRPVLAYRGEGSFDPEKAFKLIQKYEITQMYAPATALRMMQGVDSPADRFDLSHMRVVGSGGEPASPELFEWVQETFQGAVLHENYGQTEANGLAHACTALAPYKAGKIGPRGLGHTVQTVDPETAEPTVERGEVGELALRYEDDPVCFKRYWNKPEETAAKRRNGWHLMEDLGIIHEDGYVSFVSRKDDVILRSAYRISPTEVEDYLCRHESVADAGVIGVPDEQRGEIPKAFVQLVDEAEPSESLKDAIRDFVREGLAQYQYPNQIEFVDQLPTTTSGKLRRRSLREREGIT